MWWADGETGNSWSIITSFNDFTIDGLSCAVEVGGALRSCYSYTSAWNKIVGQGFTPTPADCANWVGFADNYLNGVSNIVV